MVWMVVCLLANKENREHEGDASLGIAILADSVLEAERHRVRLF